METVLIQNAEQDKSLILPNKREALISKLNDLKTNNLTARDIDHCNRLTVKTSGLFNQLRWNKIGISKDQLQLLKQEERDELALMIYEQSKKIAFIQASILACIPLVGWITLIRIIFEIMPDDNEPCFYKNLRYFLWFRKIRKISGKNFQPDLDI